MMAWRANINTPLSITRLSTPTATFTPTRWRTSGGLLKRGLHGTYISVEPFHLFRYLDEQAFRYNNRKDMNDADRFSVLVSQIVGKRLTYTSLIGKDKHLQSAPV
jgi:hypothetical protein